jgi:hypothetical protein
MFQKWLIVLLVVVFGAGFARAGDAEEILGRWDNPLTEDSYYDFKPDGTLKYVYLFGSRDCTYKLLPGGLLEIEEPGTFFGRNKSQAPYRLRGDILEIGPERGKVKYLRHEPRGVASSPTSTPEVMSRPPPAPVQQYVDDYRPEPTRWESAPAPKSSGGGFCPLSFLLFFFAGAAAFCFVAFKIVKFMLKNGIAGQLAGHAVKRWISK